MTTPPPVDLSALIAKGVLGNAKKMIEQTEPSAKAPSKKRRVVEEDEYDYSDAPMYSESDEKDIKFLTLENYKPPVATQPITYTNEQVLASNFSPAIKAVMLKKNEAVEQQVIKENSAPKPQQRTSTPQRSDMITLSKQELNEMIEAKVNEVLAGKYVKMIQKESIEKTITTLIREGKLNAKK